MRSPPSSRANSVFVDSSVLVAAAISHCGLARDLVVLGLWGTVSLHLSSLVLLETKRSLRRKRPAALPAFENLKVPLLAAIVDPPDEAVQKLVGAIETKDTPIVAAAVQAKSRNLATYDQKHLLRHREQIRREYDITVATPDEILSNVLGSERFSVKGTDPDQIDLSM
jgi:predicted nucleic acid-binding protein